LQKYCVVPVLLSHSYRLHRLKVEVKPVKLTCYLPWR